MRATPRLRLLIFLGILLTAGAVLVFSGTPYQRFGADMVNAASSYYGRSSHHGGPPTCDGNDISTAVFGNVTATTAIYWGPNTGDKIGALQVLQGQSFWIIGKDSTGDWYQITIACQLVWVPATTMAPETGVTKVVS